MSRLSIELWLYELTHRQTKSINRPTFHKNSILKTSPFDTDAVHTKNRS